MEKNSQEIKKKEALQKIFNLKGLQEKYKIYLDKNLGSGGYGEVYFGKMLTPSGEWIDCAIKVQDNFQNSEQTNKEIKIIQKLGNHSHVVEFLGAPKPDGQNNDQCSIMVMELADQSLYSYLKPRKTNSTETNSMEKPLLIQMIFDVIAGLKFAHSKNVVHLDIKPGNILIFDKELRSQFNQAQTIWVYDSGKIFKLCDWGIARIAQMHTETFKDHGFTAAFASPEMCQGLTHINPEKTDIYSFGLLILNCCGVSHKKFTSLNYMEDEKLHLNYLKKMLKDENIANKYGADMVDLIKAIVRHDHTERISLDQIETKLTEIVKEMKQNFLELQNFCELCAQNHENVIDLSCKHRFGMECFNRFFSEKFEENPVYLPKCPIGSCPKIISRKKIFEMMENEKHCVFKEFFRTCKNPICELFTYKCFLPKLSCGHRFCEECILEAFGSTMECPNIQCSEHFDKETQIKIDGFSEKCRICETETEELFKFKCCNMELCGKCFLKHFLNEIKIYSNVFCKKCNKNLSSSPISEILSIRSLKIYKSKLCMKCNKYSQKLERISNCKHTICFLCLQKSILGDRKCPIEDCEEKIQTRLLEKYEEKKEESSTSIENKKCQNSNKKIRFASKGKNEESKSKASSSTKKTEGKDNTNSTNQEEFTQFKDQKNEKTTKTEEKSPQLLCSLCSKYFKKSDILENTECGHRFCRFCLNGNFSTRLKETKIPKPPLLLKCFIEKCMKIFELKVLKEKLPEPLFVNLEAAMNMKEELQPLVKEKMAFCEKINDEGAGEKLQEILDETKPICAIEKKNVPENDLLKSECGHTYCKTCLITHLNKKIKEKRLDDIQCPNCPYLFSETFIKDLKRHDILNHYNFLLNEKYVEIWRKKWEEEQKQTSGEEEKKQTEGE